MSTTKSSIKIANAKEATVRLLEIWGSRNERTIKDLEELTYKVFHGFGTAGHETYLSPADLVGQLKREIDQVPRGMQFEIDWTEEQVLGECAVLLSCKLRFSGEVNGNNFRSDLYRASIVWRRNNDIWTVSHWHASAPDRSTEGEVFPGSKRPKFYDEVSVLFTDFVGFTTIASSIPAKKLVGELNDLFSMFDEITRRNGLEKIKTIGDAYMLAGGLNDPNADHAGQCVQWAKEVLAYLKERNERSGIKWELRVGIHSGSVVGGIIGLEKKTFDLWGDTINIASRIESQSEANRINISAYTYELIRDKFNCNYRGKVDIKGKGSIDMYFVD